jgi:RNA polymerase sigma factor (sigma-70 family)
LPSAAGISATPTAIRAPGCSLFSIISSGRGCAAWPVDRFTSRFEDTDESALTVGASQDQQLHYREVLDALAQLPEEQRSVLLLVTVEDVSYADAAKVLDVPIGTVMSRLSRARARLSDIMSGEPVPAVTQPVLRRVK